jgi:hypothetical protein
MNPADLAQLKELVELAYGDELVASGLKECAIANADDRRLGALTRKARKALRALLAERAIPEGYQLVSDGAFEYLIEQRDELMKADRESEIHKSVGIINQFIALAAAKETK